ncbi:GtrA family protein [Burkholderia guangdongensis]|uniref:GtrA family protein n=1 Tax=Burkholderia guangdongensis TaxID=1792500 RepID=UPI0015CA3981
MESAKFAVVGAIATLVHSACYLSALHWLAPQWANVSGFLCAVSVTYCGNRFWTFRGGRAGSEALLRFFVTSATGFACNAGIVAVVGRHGLDPRWAVGGMTFVTPVVMFVLFKRWVFGGATARPSANASD